MKMTIDGPTRHALGIDEILDNLARRAFSEPGAEAVRALSPAAELREVERRLKPVAEAMRRFERNRGIPLHGLADVRPYLEEAQFPGAVLAHDRWPRIAVFLDVCERMVRFAEEASEESPALASLARGVLPEPDLRATVYRKFESQGGGLTERLRDDASPELEKARRELKQAEQGLMRTVNRLVGEYAGRGWLMESYSTVRNGRHVLPFRAAFRNRVTGIVHGLSSSGETVFIEPAELVETCNRIEELTERALEEERRILIALTQQLYPWCGAGLANMERLAEMDAIHAVARSAYDMGWKIPQVREHGALRLYQAHHPLLHIARRDSSVPISVSLDRRDRVVVFSGPNAGGKTTAMKTLATSVVLVQSGIPIPASADSSLPVYAGVLADIGDRQDISAGLSTFSGHMRRIREILSAARAEPPMVRLRRGEHAPVDERVGGCLVLLDELGTGTDPSEGAALAVALLEEFASAAAVTFTTSHLDPVKQWASETAGIRNASFSLDPATKRPTYRLRLDLPGASEALEIAEAEGLPEAVLAKARALVGPERLRMGELLRSIEEHERRASRASRDAEAKAKAAADAEELARIRAEQLREDRRAAARQIAEDRERVLKETRRRVEKMIADLPAEDDMARRRAMLAATRRELAREEHAAAQDVQRLVADGRRGLVPRALRAGKRVYVAPLDEWGEVIAPPKDGRTVRLRIGVLEMEADVEDLFENDPAVERAKQKREAEKLAQEARATVGAAAPRRSRKVKAALESVASDPVERFARPAPRRSSVMDLPVPLTLDLHGFRVDEALRETDRHIDRALREDFAYVRIMHGLGSGKLYKAIHEYLRTHPSVRSYRFANDDDGGAGVTIVHL
jgi:DNA mismatch repair protein MutS2